MSKTNKFLLGLLTSLLISQTVSAATITGSLPVTASVINRCTLGAITPVAFGNYDPTNNTPDDANGSITATCTLGDVYNIGLNAGTFAGATVTTRKLTGPSPSGLPYALYRNAARTLNWGTTVGTDTMQLTGTSVPQLTTVYGRIPAHALVLAGAYTDTVGVTVTF